MWPRFSPIHSLSGEGWLLEELPRFFFSLDLLFTFLFLLFFERDVLSMGVPSRPDFPSSSSSEEGDVGEESPFAEGSGL